MGTFGRSPRPVRSKNGCGLTDIDNIRRVVTQVIDADQQDGLIKLAAGRNRSAMGHLG